jgi:hypothetical protein
MYTRIFHLSVITLFLSLLIIGCVPITVPSVPAELSEINDQDDVKVEPLTVSTVRTLPTLSSTPGANSGSFTLKILREFKRMTLDISCDSEFIVYIATTPSDPFGIVQAMGQGSGICSIYIPGYGTGGTTLTTADVPVNYEVWGIFTGSPFCTIELSIDEHIRFSEIAVIHNSVLGDIPVTDIDMGEDAFTVFDNIKYELPVFEEPLIATIAAPEMTNVFSILNLRLPNFTSCQPSQSR